MGTVSFSITLQQPGTALAVSLAALAPSRVGAVKETTSMRRFLLASAVLLTVTASATAASAAPVTFGYTGGFQTYTVPTTGLYSVLAFGAQGGDAGRIIAGLFGYTGGLGAAISGDFALTSGEVLQVAVGGAGRSTPPPAPGGGGGGGGGGSFVIAPGNMPLVVAGGGGGAAYSDNLGFGSNGGAGQIGTAGSDGIGPDGGTGGIAGTGGMAGNGGTVALGSSGGGGGFTGNGGSGLLGNRGGSGYPSGLAGVGGSGRGFSAGGFGGGGSGVSGGSGVIFTGGGGGGGGFSGGGGGGNSGGGGGGGGSYDGSLLLNADFVQLAGTRIGDGLVTIDLVTSASPIPEPTSLALFGAGLAGLLLVRQGRAPLLLGASR